MMKYTFLFFFWCIQNLLSSQTLDSIAIRQIDSLISVSLKLAGQGNYAKAFEINDTAEKSALEKLGRESVGYAATITNKGRIYYFKKDYAESEKWYFESKSILEKVVGTEVPSYAVLLNRLVALYVVMARYEQAETHSLKAKSIAEKVVPKEDKVYTDIILNQAILYKNMSRLESSESLFLELKSIRQKLLGNKHPDYAQILGSLGNLYSQMGEYEKAEPLLLESMAIQEQAVGKNNPGYCGMLINLADLYDRMVNFLRAEECLLEAKSIFEQKLSNREHPYYINGMNNLGLLYLNFGHYQKAETICLETTVLMEKAYGKEHPSYAMSLNNLAKLYKLLRQFDKAESLYLESLDIKGRSLGKSHSSYAITLQQLGSFYFTIGQYAKAEQCILEAKSIIEKTFGRNHPNYAICLNHLVDLLEIQKRFSESNKMLTEVFALNQSQLLKSVSFLSERELASYASTMRHEGDFINSYLLTRMVSTQGLQAEILPEISFDHALFLKGFLLSAASKINSLSRTTPEMQEANTLLKNLRLHLGAEYTKPISEQKDLAELEKQANAAEKKLAQAVVNYKDMIRQVNWEEVKTRLKPGEAAIEFVHFPLKFPKEADSTFYAALILSPSMAKPQFIPLFEQRSLDSLLHASSVRKADYVKGLYTLADRGAVAVEGHRRSLYEMLWKPLEDKLKEVNTIYFSPSGLLHRINLDAIPISETETLADRFNLIELNSTRQLVIPTQIKNIENDAVLFGGIQFELDSTLQVDEPMLASRSRGEVSFISVDSTLRGGSWNYLSGSEREVNAIEKIMQASGMQTNLKKGYDATEETFKNIGAKNNTPPRILHVATHGYFFTDPKNDNNLLSRTEPIFKISDHPMLRSGLILAGGNAAWQGRQPLEGKDDGILTAYEISQMNLSNTELVVLSACETGLGDIQGNEGVYGLQRAFKIAGAKYLIMSLWQVPDKQTSLLMTTFYKKLLEEKRSIPDAFHAAQKELREIGLDPYQWAGFVLVE
ncbi:MAG: CHAT domain-containing tetratricopeptide repeat protein [Saprospiraceae bacterium]